MTLSATILLAFGLAMDAAAASAAQGLAAPVARARHAALVALWFGGAQGLMPLLGALLGQVVGPAVAAWDHWIAFVLLVGLGAKAIHGALRGGEEGEEVDPNGAPRPTRDPFAARALAPLAVATSLDALAVGVTLPMLGADVVRSCVVIGVVTAALSAAALVVARRFGAGLGRKADVLGGLVLVGLGVKTLVEHL